MIKQPVCFPYSLFVLLDILDNPGTNGYDISKRHKVAFTSVYLSTKLLVNDGFVTKKRAGKTMQLRLSEKGERVAIAFRKLVAVVGQEDCVWHKGVVHGKRD